MHSPIRALPSPLADDPAVEAHVDALVAAVVAAQAGITGARPADPALAASFADAMARTAAVRGRGPIMPYLGTGMGNGPLVQLADGSVKWDMINGIGVHMFGHGDPRMVRAAVRAGLSDLCMQGNLTSNADSVAFAELLVQEAAKSSSIAHCFVSNSGCMVNETALKICMQKTGGAPRVIAFQDCFLGRSITMTQIGDSAAYRQGIPLSTLVDYMPFYDPSLGPRSIEMAVWHLKQYVHRYPGQQACFVMELVQGEGGFNVAPREFFMALIEVCRAAGIPVWDDEVQTFGRTERMFCFEALDLGRHVDVVTVGKMSQACACLYTADMNPKHAAFREHAGRLVDRHPEWFPAVRDAFGRESRSFVGGTGGMCRMTPFGGDKDRIMRFLHVLFAEGVMAFYCGHGPYHVRMLPPVGVMRPEQWEPVFEIVERAMAKSCEAGGA